MLWPLVANHRIKEQRRMSLAQDDIIATLKQHASAQGVEGMIRFGVRPAHPLGIAIPVLRKMARTIGRNHPLALELWTSGIHEAKILASMIADPHLISPQQMDEWVN